MQAENSLRLAIEAFRRADATHRPAKAKSVEALAEAVLSARVRRLKAILNKSSEQRLADREKYTPTQVSAQRRNLEKLQRSDVSSVLKEFGVDVSEVAAVARSNKSLERSRDR